MAIEHSIAGATKLGMGIQFKRIALVGGLILVLSVVLLIGVLWQTVSMLSNTPKQEVEKFVRRVTNDLLDTSYDNYQAGLVALINPDSGELEEPAISALREGGILAKSKDEEQSNLQKFVAGKRKCAVEIQNVKVGDLDQRGLVPVDVAGTVTVKAKDVKDNHPKPFHFHYELGYKRFRNVLLVADFSDLSK